MFRQIILAVAFAVPVGPALADNMLTLRLSPRNALQADALRLGLVLYAINRDIQDGATIEQVGRNNAARIVQGDTGNFGLIQQHGDNHAATLDQPGSSGAYAVFQSGKGATAYVRDSGTGVLLQYGW